jgi:geranylgeranylglycerol-phosphate geranylgeranyltransferase
MRHIASFIALLRPHNVAAAVLSVAVGFSMTGSREWPWLLFAAAACATAAGHTVNDICDLAIDRVNRPKRPLVSGALSVRGAWIEYGVLVAAALASAVFLPHAAAAWIVAWVVLLHLYSAKLKRVCLAGNALVAVVAASGFLLGSYAGHDIGAGMLPAAYTFFFVMGREIVKDADDIAGDRSLDARTFPIVSGTRAALATAAAIFACLCVTLPLPSELGVYRSLYALIMLCTLVPILIVSIVLVLRNRSLGAVSSLLKVGMFFGCLAFYFGPKR